MVDLRFIQKFMLFFTSCAFGFVSVDFEQSMRQVIEDIPNTVPHDTRVLSSLFKSSFVIKRRAKLFKQLFDFCTQRVTTSPDAPVKIPKIIHQIWLGNKPIPHNLNFAINSVKKKHPSWEHKLWTDAEVMQLDTRFKWLLGKDSPLSVGKKADIARLVILDKFGGVYLDLDYFCSKPLDELHHSFEFYCGLISEWFDIGNGVLGCTPGHPLIKYSLSKLKIKSAVLNKRTLDTMRYTGPYFLTKCIERYLRFRRNELVMIFPLSYFHPMGGNQRSNFWLEHESFDFVRGYEGPETYAIHLWASTWNNDCLYENNKLMQLLEQNNLLFYRGRVDESINARRESDRATPAIVAAQRGLVQTIDLLGRSGADFSLQDVYGKTALDHAYQLGHDKVAHIIESYLL